MGYLGICGDEGLMGELKTRQGCYLKSFLAQLSKPIFIYEFVKPVNVFHRSVHAVKAYVMMERREDFYDR